MKEPALKKPSRMNTIALVVVFFALSQFVVTVFMQNELWMLWWMGVVMPAYLVMVPVTIVQAVIAVQYIIAGGKNIVFNVAMIAVCIYVLWSVYISYTIFAGN